MGEMSSPATITKTVFKATRLFTGTQAVGVLGSVVRTKLIAVLIGEAGIGLFGLFNNAVDLIGALTQMNLRSSAVREVSALSEKDDRKALARMIATVRRWGWILGLFGAIVMAAASPLLSLSAFGTPSTVMPFLLLSAAMLFNSASEAEKAVMQGLRQLTPLAKAMTWGVVAGCLISLPMIWFWRIDSVAPVILAYSLSVFAVTWLFRDRTAPCPEPPRLRQSLETGRSFMKLGFFMTVSSASALGCSYIFLTWLNASAGTDVMGEYQAGYTLIIKYAGFLFTAIGLEYFPRMSAAAVHGIRRLRVFMKHELRMLTLMTAAFVALLTAFAPWIVRLLYSGAFVPAAAMVQWGAPGIVLRAASVCVAFVILAKGDGSTYLKCEVTSSIVGLMLNVAAFSLWGVPGAGVSYTVWYLFYFLMVSLVVRRRYGIACGSRLLALVGLCTGGVLAVSLCALFFGMFVALPIALLLLLLSVLFLRRRR